MGKKSEKSVSLTTVDVTAHSQGPKSTLLKTDTVEFVIGKEATPLEYLLGSLAACINVIGHLVAKDHDIVLHEIDIDVQADIDPAKYKGESSEPRAGFQSIRVAVRVAADADDDTLQTWMYEVADRCPVAENLKNPSTIELSVQKA